MSDIESLIAQITDAREKLISQRQTALDTVATIDRQLAQFGVTAPGGQAPKRRGRPPKNPVAVPYSPALAGLAVTPPVPVNGHHTRPKGEVPNTLREFIPYILGKAPGIGMDSLKAAAEDHLSGNIERKDLHNMIFQLKNKGLIVRKGSRGDATYYLAK